MIEGRLGLSHYEMIEFSILGEVKKRGQQNCHLSLFMTFAWLQRELCLELRQLKQVYDLWKKGQATQENYKGIIRLCR